jgi:hypothetical protein
MLEDAGQLAAGGKQELADPTSATGSP